MAGEAVLDEIIGCRIETHYGTGGVVKSYSGPYSNGYYTLVYEGHRGGKCWLNTIRISKGVITCEGKPLRILERVEPVQISFIDSKGGLRT